MAANWYARMCGDNYWSARSPQLDRIEAYAAGHAADIDDFYERVEPRITFCDILIHTGRVRRAELAQDSAHG